MSGKRYPEEFKIEAVKQVVDRGYSVSSVATRLDITPPPITRTPPNKTRGNVKT